ncbi:hypothetical protein LWE61_14920 [Sphingobium sufflavum]|uniref:hypothetical protein n=1 Tax=Sphingobium sufflavum TaxID=1129547 RepID=UPI001F1914D9|nr:hypothetical protein [Sphingobium sufflavum]MCE7797842.1 hypothetical protein [Sphingobium sufflavum]
MSIEVTPHGRRPVDQNDTLDALAAQPQGAEGSMFEVNAAVSAPVTRPGLYRIYATTDCRVRAGTGLANANGGARFPAGSVEVWWLESGMVIACAEVA